MTEMEINLGQPDWFAVQVKARWEQSTARILSGKGYETLLPLYKAERRSGGRLRTVDVPLFPSYLFCRFAALNRLPILVTPGVMSIVSRCRIPVPVEPGEIASLQKLVSSGIRAEPWPYIALGDKVRVETTPLQGLEGILIAHKSGHRVVVSVSLLQRSVAVEIDRAGISAVGKPPAQITLPTCESQMDEVLI
jgi:transcription termination/antitermination protein NusG